MLFYIGTHRITHAKHFERCFISVNILRKRKSQFPINNWILDSGAFTEISTYGHYRYPVTEYAAQIEKWARCGNLEYAVSQDYMCEPFIITKTGLSIRKHQELTFERYRQLETIKGMNNSPVSILPVLQ